jgi:predicted ATPase
MTIRTPDQRLRVFVSSTLGELADERKAVARSISALRLTPVLFEIGARPHPPQDLYRAYLAQSDIFIGLYWQRYGQPAPGMPVSGLEEELELSRALPRLLYVKTPAPDREQQLDEMLSRIKAEATESYRRFRTPAELGRLVRDDLATLLSERFAGRPDDAGIARRGGDAAVDEAAAPRAPKARASEERPGSAAAAPHRLPASITHLIGRGPEIEELASLLMRAEVRLLTLTGPGGIGKTRLAAAVGEKAAAEFGAGSRVVFVPLDSVTRPELVLAGIGRACGANLSETSAPLEALADQFGTERWLVVLDNLEQVVAAAPDIQELLVRCPGLTILATSRTVLGLQAEREYPVAALSLPAAAAPTAAVAASPAVALFVDRATAVRPGFALSDANAAAVAEICRRLEGLPLAIELAAARTRLLDPGTLLDRLSRSLDALGTSTAELPERQQTLRATVEWSVGLLDPAERSLLQALAVFVNGWTPEAAASVAALDEYEALDLCEALARHSLIYLESTDRGPRQQMLDTVRVFVAEQLAARPDADEIGHRHAQYYRALAEQAGGLLRGTGWNEWAERLEVEAGNIAAAVRWFLRFDRRPLPHLFRELLPLWAVKSNDLREVRSWVDELLPTADSLDTESRAELLWAAAVTARELGDNDAALAARQRLGPLLPSIDDQYLRAVCALAIGWTAGIMGDLDTAVRMAATSLQLLRSQDEPLWTTAALVSLGSVETPTGHHEDALGHLREARELAQRVGNPRLTASSTVQLGVLALARRRPAEARALLGQGLALSLSIHSIRNLILTFGAYAQLAFADGDPERATVLTGAAEGARQRAGLRAWPTAGPLTDQLREALGTGRHEVLFTAGTKLTLREAADAATGPASS